MQFGSFSTNSVHFSFKNLACISWFHADIWTTELTKKWSYALVPGKQQWNTQVHVTEVIGHWDRTSIQVKEVFVRHTAARVSYRRLRLSQPKFGSCDRALRLARTDILVSHTHRSSVLGTEVFLFRNECQNWRQIRKSTVPNLTETIQFSIGKSTDSSPMLHRGTGGWGQAGAAFAWRTVDRGDRRGRTQFGNFKRL